MNNIIFDFPYALNIDLVRIITKKNGVNSLENNLEIKNKRPVFDVINVVLRSFSNGSITPQAVDLRPACHAGFCAVAFQVPRYLIFEFLYKVLPFRTGSNNAHIAFDNINQLRKFVQTEAAQKPAEPRCSGIIFLGPDRTARLFRVSTHGPEFNNFEYFTTQSYPFLEIKDRPF